MSYALDPDDPVAQLVVNSWRYLNQLQQMGWEYTVTRSTDVFAGSSWSGSKSATVSVTFVKPNGKTSRYWWNASATYSWEDFENLIEGEAISDRGDRFLFYNSDRTQAEILACATRLNDCRAAEKISADAFGRTDYALGGHGRRNALRHLYGSARALLELGDDGRAILDSHEAIVVDPLDSYIDDLNNDVAAQIAEEFSGRGSYSNDELFARAQELLETEASCRRGFGVGGCALP
ncbi:MAG: hypothetical protein R2770_00895 [Acidimicrobiales bacterium]